jgi:uncharacterized membrane protein YphA (DoxX/SURF4 family)
MQTALNSYAVLLLLRVALGIMFLSHNLIYMLGTLTLTGAADYFVSIGLPRWLAYTTFIAEALGGLLMVLGIKTRWVALALSPILLGATWAQSLLSDFATAGGHDGFADFHETAWQCMFPRAGFIPAANEQ